jgi:hypothetical protein
MIMTLAARAQNLATNDFVVDKSKPYVYLRFDHVGPRKPVQDGEGNVGLWIRVVNNCRIPIVLQSFSMPPGTAGVGLFDEVVENEPTLQVFSTPQEGKQIQRDERLRKANTSRMDTRPRRVVSSEFNLGRRSSSAFH